MKHEMQFEQLIKNEFFFLNRLIIAFFNFFLPDPVQMPTGISQTHAEQYTIAITHCRFANPTVRSS
jgi:hypothetical protein